MLSVAVSDSSGSIYRDESMRAVARTGNLLVELLESDVIPMPEGGSLMRLPGRAPIGIGATSGQFTGAGPEEAVAAILPQGYTRTFLPAYISLEGAPELPLFGYSAVAIAGDQLMVAAIRTDERDTWNPVHYNLPSLADEAERLVAQFPQNRIVAQLARCATEYQCFTAQNIFYRRWEGGIPVSPTCNANCLGCISLQQSECCPSPQQRIDFAPTVSEIVEVALPHLDGATDGIISFGQGCEGEPTCEWQTIAEACREIRSHTDRGTINVNTNAGNVHAIRAISDAGVDSLRVSLASARPNYYARYHRPHGFGLVDVERSIIEARSRGLFVSLNYLVFPGFFDQEPEVDALCDLIDRCDVQMLQLRNINIDPDVYARIMLVEDAGSHSPKPAGVEEAVAHISDCFPALAIGNFTLPFKDV
ncbi:MAG: radical SAM protein [Firmicutes bacterium]|nr:radical SAM protein [Bacillota bacterium]